MSKPITATNCERDLRAAPPRNTCLQALAGGWITVMDLCPRCTGLLMGALDAASPEPLDWHRGFTARAARADR